MLIMKKLLLYLKNWLNLKLPYFGKESIKLKRKLKGLFSHNNLNFINFRVIFTSGFRIGDMFRFKDRMPKRVSSHLVYYLKCDACSASYVGKTTQCLYERFDKGYFSGREYSAFGEHTTEFGPEHTFSFDK